MIENVSYQTMEDGSLKGAQHFLVEINDGVGIETAEAIDTVLKITAHKSRGCKLVIFIGKFAPENSDDLFALAKALIDAGYVIGCYCDGRVFYPWMTMANFISVNPIGPWLGFKVTEFVWFANTEARLQLPPNPEKTNLFIIGTPEERHTFMKDSPLPWRAWGVSTYSEIL